MTRDEFAHAAGAPEERVVGGKAAGEALGVLGELGGDVIEALQQLEGNAVHLADGLEDFAVRLPDECLRCVEIGRGRGGRRQSLQCGGEPLEPRDQVVSSFISDLANGRGLSDFACSARVQLL